MRNLILSAQVKQNEMGEKKPSTHLDFHMLCSPEANIIPWMLVIKQCDMDNSYALSLFRQAFFLVNKALEGLKYNQSESSVLRLTIHGTCFLLLPQSDFLATSPGDSENGDKFSGAGTGYMSRKTVSGWSLQINRNQIVSDLTGYRISFIIGWSAHLWSRARNFVQKE